MVTVIASRSLRCLLLPLLAFFVFTAIAFALPQGENVISGSATFDSSTSNSLTITTPSDNLIVEYNSFSIAQNEAVRFQQPSSESIALNRVVGVDPSSIMGTMSANGRIFLVNPNGVLFGPNCKLDVAGLVASTMGISNEDFLKGNYQFAKNGINAFILNQGEITVRNGGYACLLSQAVDNQGLIQAELGTVVLAAGEKVTLGLDDLNEISVVVDQAVSGTVLRPDGTKIDSAIKNSGTISANGGKVILNAKVLNKVFDYAINNNGIIEAQDLVSNDGVIELMAEGAPVINTGKIEAGEVRIEVAQAGLINQGTIQADEIKIKVPDQEVVNKGVISADARAGDILPNGGRISIEASSVLQQGMISANAAEAGTAGEVVIVSETSTTLDTASTTQAKAVGLVGTGGKVSLKSLTGNVVVNKLAVIDVSAGSVAGNGGSVDINAFSQLGFYGVLSGRAPPGYKIGTAYFDPEFASISGQVDMDLVVDAWKDITIAGDITIGDGVTLTLLADHKSQTEWDDIYDPGTGSILNPNDYTISEEQFAYDSKLVLKAGSGIGSADHPIRTDVSYLDAEINPAYQGDIIISQGDESLDLGLISTPKGTVYISGLGSIYDGNGQDLNIAGTDLIMLAVYGIGTWNPLETAVFGFMAVNSDYGNIEISNTGPLCLSGIINLAPTSGNVDNGFETGSVQIDSDQDILVRYSIYAEGDIGLTSGGSVYLSTLADLMSGATLSINVPNGGFYIQDLETDLFDLLGYWNFNEETGSVANDLSGNGFNGVINGNPVWSSGIYGGALTFDANGDYVEIANYLNIGSSPFTLLLWYKGGQVAPYVGLAGAVDPTGMRLGFTLENHNGFARSWVNSDTDDAGGFNISDNLWHQLVMTRDGSSGSLSFDGMSYSTSFATSAESVDSTGKFWIGGWGYLTRLAQGSIDEVRVYTKVLSPLEIAAQYMIPPGTGSLISPKVKFVSGNGIDVTLSGLTSLELTNTGIGNINVVHYGDLSITGSGIYNAAGDISLTLHSNLIINADIISDAVDGTITISADGDIEIHDSYIGTSTIAEQPAGTVIGNNVNLYAGRDIILDQSEVYSYVEVYSDNSASGQSGSILLSAGRNIQLYDSYVYSQVFAGAGNFAQAVSGDVSLIAYTGTIDLLEGSDVSSAADANAGEGQQAVAVAGDVSLNALGKVSIEDIVNTCVYSNAYANYAFQASATSGSVTVKGSEIYATTNIYSQAYAEGYDGAVAQSGTVSLQATSAGIYIVDGAEVWSQAKASAPYGASAAATAGSVSLTAAGEVVIEEAGDEGYGDDYCVFSYAYANSVGAASATSGDVSVSGTDLGIYTNVYSYADAYGYIEAVSTAGDVSLTANGLLEIWADIYSYAASAASYTASAVSGDVEIENSGIVSLDLFDIAIYSQAFANSVYSSASATSGEVSLATGGSASLEWVNLYSLATVYGPSSVYGRSGNVYLNSGADILLTYCDIYSQPSINSYSYNIPTINLYSAMVSLTSGQDIELYASNIYSKTLVMASSNAYAYSDYISLSARGNIYFNDQGDLPGSRVYSSSQVSSASTSGQAYAGKIYLRADGTFYAGDGTYIQSLAEAKNCGSALAVSGGADIYSGGLLTLGDIVLDIYANAENSQQANAQAGGLAITVWGGGGFVFQNDLAVISYAQGANSVEATAGSISITGSSFVVPAGVKVYSQAEAYSTNAAGSAKASSGSLGISAYGSFTAAMNTWIYSSALASSPNNAQAYSGPVNIWSSADMYLLGANLYSAAYNQEYDGGVNYAYLRSGDISVYTYEDLMLGECNFYSEAESADTDEVYAYSGRVSFEAEGGIYPEDEGGASPDIFSNALAKGYDIAQAYSGDVDISAFYDIIFYSSYQGVQIYTGANAFGKDTRAEAGNLIIKSELGDIDYAGAELFVHAQADGGEFGDAYSATAISGDLTLEAGGSLYSYSDIYSEAVAYSYKDVYAQSGSVTFDIGGSIELGEGQGVSSLAVAESWAEEGGSAEAYSGDVFLSAAGDIEIFYAYVYSKAIGYSVNSLIAAAGDVSLIGDSLGLEDSVVYSAADFSPEEYYAWIPYVSFSAGDVALSADGALTIDESWVYSQALAEATGTVSAVSGDISLEAKAGAITVSSGSLIYTKAQALQYSESTPASADAVSGMVKIIAAGTIDLDLDSVYSYAEANYAHESSASSAGVTVTSTNGDILTYADIYSSAFANAEDSSSATSGAVSLKAAGQIPLGGPSFVYVYSEASAQVQGGSSAYAESEDVTVDAGGAVRIEYGSQVYSSAQAYGVVQGASQAQAYSGDVKVKAESIRLDQSGYVYSYAGAQGSDEAGSSATAISKDVTLEALLDDIWMSNYSDVYSGADAYSADIAVASSGDITFDAQTISVNDKCVYTYADAEGLTSAEATSGDVLLDSTGNMDVYYEPVYSQATAEAGQSAVANSGDISLIAGGHIWIMDVSTVYSKSMASGTNAGASGEANSGDVVIDSGDDVTVDGSSRIYSGAYASGESRSTATTGNIRIDADGDFLADYANIYTVADRDRSLEFYDDLLMQAGDISINCGANLDILNSYVFSIASPATSDIGNAQVASGSLYFISQAGNIEVSSASYVYTLANIFDSASAEAIAGNIEFSAKNLDIYSDVYSMADVTARGSATVTSGDIDVSCLDLNIQDASLYTSADAEGVDYAQASSGDVEITSNGKVSVIDNVAGADSKVYSKASSYASGGSGYPQAYSYSGDVSVDASGDVTFKGKFYDISANYAKLYSSADSYGQSSTEAIAGDVSVSTDANLYIGDCAEVYSEALINTQIAPSSSYLESGLIELSAGQNLKASLSEIYSSASAYAQNSAEAFSKDISLKANAGLEIQSAVYSYAYAESLATAEAASGKLTIQGMGVISDTSPLYSQAQAVSQGTGVSQASATSGGIDLISYFSLQFSGGTLYSLAQAQALYGATGTTSSATSGSLNFFSVSTLTINEYYNPIYTQAVAQGGDTAQAVSGDIGFIAFSQIDNSVDTYTYAEATLAQVANAASGQVSYVSSTNLVLNADTYTHAYANGAMTSKAAAKDVSVLCSAALTLGDNSGVYSLASAWTGMESLSRYTAEAVSGKVSLSAGLDIGIGDGAEVYSAAYASDPYTAKATSKAVSVIAGGNIIIGYEGLIQSYAEAMGETITEVLGDLFVVANGDIELPIDLYGNTVTLIADADLNGAGSLQVGGEGVTLYGYSHGLGGANDFELDNWDGSQVVLIDGESYLALTTPDENPSGLLGLEVTSTLPSTVTVSGSVTRQNYIRLYSNGDLGIYADLTAPQLSLVADSDDNGSGNLYSDGEVNLYTQDLTISGADDFVVGTDTIEYGLEGGFQAILNPYGKGQLEDLTLISTGGNIVVSAPLTRSGTGVINLSALGDVNVNAPITSDSPVYIEAREGSIIASGEGTHLSAASGDSLLRAGSTIGSETTPFDVLIGSGSLHTDIAGQDEAGTSGVFSGSTPSNTIAIDNEPPGKVYFNQAQIWPALLPPEPPQPPEPPLPPLPPQPPVEVHSPEEPGMSGFTLAQSSYSLVLRPILPTIVQAQFNLLNVFTGTAYFYSPLTPMDMTAFNDFVIEEDAYEFVEGAINLIGHEGLLPLLDQVK